MLTIEFDAPGYDPAPHFDHFGRRAAETLESLFPGAHITLRYTQVRENPDMPSWTRVEHPVQTTPDVLADSAEPIAGESRWWRQMTLRMAQPIREFLGIPEAPRIPMIMVPPLSSSRRVSTDTLFDGAVISVIGAAGHKVFRQEMPPELKYAFSISEDLARDWARHLDGQECHDMAAALGTHLPNQIISHIAANYFLEFAGPRQRPERHALLARTIAKTLDYYTDLATTRVEHRALSHAVIIAPVPRKLDVKPIATYPDDFTRLKRTPLLANGDNSALWISPEGHAVRWILAGSSSDPTTTSARRLRPSPAWPFIGQASQRLRGLALALRPDGSIVLFSHGHPVFVHRSGKWRGMMWRRVREALNTRFGELGAVAFDAASILATRGDGGLFAIVDQLPPGVHEKDQVSLAVAAAARIGDDAEYVIRTDDTIISRPTNPLRGRHPEWCFHALVPDGSVVSLGAYALATLAAIDGATIISKEGALLAYGAVVPSQPSEAEGARSAAARRLSEYGLVIKVSADGPIALFVQGGLLFEM